MASQWPQNYQPAQGQGYNQYPQQYPQQPPQQYAQQPQPYAQYPQPYVQQPQQYAQQQAQYYPPDSQTPAPHHYPQQAPQQQYPQQGGQYPSQYPPAANTGYATPDQSQLGQQGCYNCGNPGHWAQDCPEPRREVPAGAYNRPPFKRHKPNPPVVTKYAVPPHVQQTQGQPPYNYGAAYGAQHYPQYQGPPGPPTPMSGQSPSQQQWQQQPYPQQYQHPYPQQQQYPQPYQQPGYQQQQQTYMQTAPPTPATPYGSHYAHQGFPQVAQAYAASYLQNSQHHQEPGPQSQPMASASPVSAASQTVSCQHQQCPALIGSNAPEAARTHQGSRNSSVSMQSMSVTSKQQSAEPPEEDYDNEDLSKLDVPDIPAVIDGSFASLVDRPLPANFIVADALEPFDPPQAENDGRCQSKYVLLDASSTFHLCIKDTKHWEDLKNDPIFRHVREGSRVIPLQRIMSIHRPRELGDEGEQAELEEGEWTQHTEAQHHEGRDLMDRLEHSLSAGHSMEPPGTVSRNVSFDRTPRRKSSTYSRPDRPFEDATTLCGIDGPYWPHHNAIRPFPPPPVREESPVPSPERTPPMRSRTPSMYELNELYQQEYGARPGSTALDSAATAPRDSKKRSSDTLDPFDPPPPPPHLRKPASYDGASEDPPCTGSPNGHSMGNGVSGSGHGLSNGRSCSNEHSASPTQVRHNTANGRKGDQDEQALSEEDNTPKRRQADDTKTKLKRRQQPKIAAAYSRRW